MVCIVVYIVILCLSMIILFVDTNFTPILESNPYFYFHIIFFTNLIIKYHTPSFLQMGKFFMPKQNHHQSLLQETDPKPKTHRLQSKQTNKKDKTKHRHYKLQIYDELLALIRLKHLKYISNTVKELRSLR